MKKLTAVLMVLTALLSVYFPLFLGITAVAVIHFMRLQRGEGRVRVPAVAAHS